MGLRDCPETSVTNNELMLHKIPEACRSRIAKFICRKLNISSWCPVCRCGCADHSTERYSVLFQISQSQIRAKMFILCCSLIFENPLNIVQIILIKNVRNKSGFYTRQERETLPGGHHSIKDDVQYIAFLPTKSWSFDIQIFVVLEKLSYS
jgi:hypothetical protein